jgi:hypothetical protein
MFDVNAAILRLRSGDLEYYRISIADILAYFYAPCSMTKERKDAVLGWYWNEYLCADIDK